MKRRDNMGLAQRKRVSAEIAREYRAWKAKKGREPSEAERRQIIAIGFSRARAKDPRVPQPNPLLMTVMGNPGGWKGLKAGDRMMIDRIVGNLHVGASAEEVEQTIRRKLKSTTPEAWIQKAIAYAIHAHQRNAGVFRTMRFNGKQNPKGPVFCGPACRSGFKADRAAGVIYPPIIAMDSRGQRTGETWTREQYSARKGVCAYCSAQVKHRNNPAPKGTESYKTISVGRVDPFYGGFERWYCLCGEYWFSSERYNFPPGERVATTISCHCGNVIDLKEVDAFYRRRKMRTNPLTPKEVHKIQAQGRKERDRAASLYARGHDETARYHHGVGDGHYQVAAEYAGRAARRNPKSGSPDPEAARELSLFIENDADLYRQQYVPILRNLMIKRAKGIFDPTLAAKLFMYLMESGAKKYIKEFSTPGQRIDEVFNKATREMVAKEFVLAFITDADLGNYDYLLPKMTPRQTSRRGAQDVMADMAMWEQGFRYKLVPIKGKCQPLYAKTIQEAGALKESVPGCVFKVITMRPRSNPMRSHGNPRRSGPPPIPPVITHKNMGPFLDAIAREPEFQPGSRHTYDASKWYRRPVWLEFPLGELAKDTLTTMALVGRERPDPLPLTGEEGFNAQGLEGKVRIQRDLFTALLKLRDILPPFRGRIVTRLMPGRNPLTEAERRTLTGFARAAGAEANRWHHSTSRHWYSKGRASAFQDVSTLKRIRGNPLTPMERSSLRRTSEMEQDRSTSPDDYWAGAAAASRWAARTYNPMRKRAMGPETIKRRSRELAEARARSRASLIERLRAAVRQHGQDSIYAEMLQEALSRPPTRPNGIFVSEDPRHSPNPLTRKEQALLTREAHSGFRWADQFLSRGDKKSATNIMQHSAGIMTAMSLVKPHRVPSGLVRQHGRVYRTIGTKPNPSKRTVTMSLEKFAQWVKRKRDPKMWKALIDKFGDYTRWTAGAKAQKVTLEMVNAPGVSGLWIVTDLGKEPEKTYIMPKGSKRKGAWKHPWSRMPSLKGDAKAGIMITKMARGNRLSDFLHGN